MKEPKIRFKGFQGEWEETSLGKLSTNYKYGINAAAIPYDGTNKYLRITDIDENTRMFSQEDLTSPGTDLSCCNEYLLEEGDITIARTGASVGKSYIYHLSYGKVYFAGFLIRTRLNENVDKDYVFYSTLTDKYAKYIRLVSQRSGQPGVNVEELKGYTFNLPCDKAEQQSIASYFQHLDTLIQSTTKKIESLKQVKAASLQSMFPQEGETTPRVRFKGFEGEWEETTIGESMVINSGMDYKHLSEGDVPVYGTGGYMLSVNECLSEVDAIGIGRKGTIDKPQLLKAPFWTVDTLFFLTPQNKELHFLYALCQKINWRNYDESTGVPSLSKVSVSKIKLAVPSYAEQRAIASYFTTLDRQITLQTQRLEKLKQIKSACLDNMFV